MTYGESLSSLHFNEVTFVDAEEWNTEVPGTLAWSVPDGKPEAREWTAQWKFTPDNEEYAERTGTFCIFPTLDHGMGDTPT